MIDVIVIGAGPAGATIARLLARSKRRVLLVDKSEFPRHKVCGCCINSIAAGVLDKIGLTDLIASQGAIPFHELAVFENKIRAKISLPTGFALSRGNLDSALIDAAIKNGVEFMPHTTARVQAVSEDARLVSLQRVACSEQVAAKLVIVADGLSGMSLNDLPEFATSISKNSRFGAGVVIPYSEQFYEKGRIYMACSNYGYVGLVRIEDNQLDVAVALEPEFSRHFGSPALASAEILTGSGLPLPEGFTTIQWTGTGALTRTRSSVAAERLFVIGDACGYTEPFTGEGISWALSAAVRVQPLADAAIESWRPEFVQTWQKQHQSLIGKRQKVSAIVASCLKKGSLRRFCLTALSVVPQIASPIVDAIASRKLPSGQIVRSANVVEN